MDESIRICRFCLSEEKNGTDNLINAFDGMLDFFRNEILNCLGINLSHKDPIPSLICKNCISFIHKIHSFLQTVRKSEKVLQELYKIPSRKSNNTIVSSDEDLKVNPQETPQIINAENDDDQNSCDFVSCDSDSSYDDANLRKGEKILNTSSSPDLPKNDATLFFEGGKKVDIFDMDSRVFSSNIDLETHERNHKVSCEECKVQVLPSSLDAHMKKHTDAFKCANCDKGHTSRAAMEKHYRARHAGIKGYVCHICGKQNSCQSSMKRHLASHLTLRPYKCKFCSFSAKSRTVLKIHISRKHSNQTSSCEICRKMFKSVLSLKQHIKRIHNPKKHECNVCEKAFSEKYNLNQHVYKKHSRQRIYDCKICHEEFFTVKKLKEHKHSHREGCVSCPKCGREFCYKKILDRHLLKCSSDNKKAAKLKSSKSMPNTTTEYNES